MSQLRPDATTFFAVVHRHCAALAVRGYFAPAPATGARGFVPLHALTPGQREVSVDNVMAKLRDDCDELGCRFDDATQQWTLAQDKGRALLPVNDPVMLVRAPFGLVVVDGHHHVFMSLYVGAVTVPALVVEDLSALSPVAFWAKLKARNLVFLDADAKALAAQPPQLDELRDNPNRYYASLIAIKVRLGCEDGALVHLGCKKNRDGVWVKLNEGVPFVEFHIAEALTAAGLRYDPAWDDNVPNDAVEVARKALYAARDSGAHAMLERVPMLPDRAAADAAHKGQPRFLAAMQRFLQEQGLDCTDLNDNFSAAVTRRRGRNAT